MIASRPEVNTYDLRKAMTQKLGEYRAQGLIAGCTVWLLNTAIKRSVYDEEMGIFIFSHTFDELSHQSGYSKNSIFRAIKILEDMQALFRITLPYHRKPRFEVMPPRGTDE